MADVWIPLNGGEGEDRKKPRHTESGWQMPSYKGADESMASETWLGLRLDDYIVVDCDTIDAANTWLRHIGGASFAHTVCRITPHGYHFFYRRTRSNLDVTARVPLMEKIDLKLGKGHYVVYYGDGYSDYPGNRTMMDFDPAWVPEKEHRHFDEWSEMPEGMGDNAMIAFAGTFRRYGMSQETMERCLAEINRITMTEDPMKPGRIRRLARSAARYDAEETRKIMCPKCANEIEVI